MIQDEPWTFAPFADARSSTVATRLRWARLRLRARLARELYVRARCVISDAFGYGVASMYRHARSTAPDLAVFHSEGGLWAAARLDREGVRVGVDFEDWFSRDLPPESRRDRPTDALAKLEQLALTYPYVTAASHSMADALANAYGGRRPAVIYNTFAPGPRRTMKAADAPIRLHWFSQTLGPGRGLEFLLEALSGVTGDWHLTLRGDDPTRFGESLIARLPERLRSRVELAPTVPSPLLPAKIAEHDVGLALETVAIPNKDVTVSNKLFQYLSAGLAIIATGTAGHREVLSQAPLSASIVNPDDPDQLRAALQVLVNDRSRVRAMQDAAFVAANTLFAQSRQSSAYAELAQRALQRVPLR